MFGGPPCQSFSRAGKRGSVDDERGQLFLEFVRIVRDTRPRWFLFENVKGLLLTKTSIWFYRCASCGREEIPPFEVDRLEPAESVGPACLDCGRETKWVIEKNKKGGALDLIVSEFERIGYSCTPMVLNAADFGAPQLRERLFIIGSRDGERCSLPVPTHGSHEVNRPLPAHRTVWEALFNEPNPNHMWPLDPNLAVLWVKNVVRPHDEPVCWTLLRPAPTIGAHQGAKLAIAPFGVPPEQLARQQWHVLGKRQGDTPPVPVEHSYLGDDDLLTLQTFPVSWAVMGTRMERAFQIGNAVPPLLGRAVAGALLTKSEKATVSSAVVVSPKRVARNSRQRELFSTG